MKYIFSIGFLITITLITGSCTPSQNQNRDINKIIEFNQTHNAFKMTGNNYAAPVIFDNPDEKGLSKIINLFRNDIKMVSGNYPKLYNNLTSDIDNIIIVGIADKSPLLKTLESRNKINLNSIKGKWETSIIQVIDQPFEGIKKALIIAGSDKRGTIFGLFELSKQMGVSPWYWWADVPVQKHEDIYVKNGRYNYGEPKVQYRGIFINDEEPALGNWAREKFGGINSKFYQKVFELILRMKGNYLWPAMWGKAFADDDPMNAVLADELGIVIGYSHHEPMMRAHKEWKKYGEGKWDYTVNKENLKEFWRGGIQRNLGKESIITVGMRGDGDEPMSNDRNIELLTEIINDQRQIIEEETGNPAEMTPQVWALYKEVQDYYDMGMRVPNDIMLLYCDDNWGNVRRLPGKNERNREGGCGLYYHFDYVGDPRNYKWINTNPLPKIWEQNKLAYEYGINKLWIVNVGDIKPMELPIQFYLDLAWNPDYMGVNELKEYTIKWSEQQFGQKYYKEIASILDRYGKYASRVKPELLNKVKYSLINYREYERVANELNTLCREALTIGEKISNNKQDAYFQLVQYPVEALTNIYNLYHVVEKNHFYYKQKRALTNLMADSVKYYFELDSTLKHKYNNIIANGKWNHIMDQPKIGYSSWNDPKYDILPTTYRIKLPQKSIPGINIEGDKEELSIDNAKLLEFDSFNNQTYFIELFNKGVIPYDFEITSDNNWIELSQKKGKILDQSKIYVSINWDNINNEDNKGTIYVKIVNEKYSININAWKPSIEKEKNITGFIENNGYISIEASNFSRSVNNDSIEWVVIPDIGLTKDGVTTKPSMIEEQTTGKGPYLEYDIYIKASGTIKIYSYFSPTLNFINENGLKYAISLNNELPHIINVHKNKKHNYWQNMVSNNINICKSEHLIVNPGNNKLKFHMISPGLVLQKIVVDTGGLKESKLGPKEVKKINK
ncbi:MAG: glycosyl hydrolase 115 family protein [Marinilabiliaceae bacterium]|nr:glycosyl hydrolase 115 family protein [Marinilabiliaceae bacterium]